MSKLIRLTPDETVGVFQSGRVFSVVDLGLKTVIASGNNLDSLLVGREWEVPNSLVAAGMSQAERRKKAQHQPRDSNGRFVGAGANVKYYSNGTEWSGTVDAIKEGKAKVSVRLPDGSVSQRTLDPNTLSVYTSKARIPSKNSLSDDDNDTGGFIARNRPKIIAQAQDGGVQIQRADGYSVDAKAKSGSNVLMYQLYGPGGQSIGIYNEDGENTFDDIIAADIEAYGSSEQVVVKASAYEVPEDVRINALTYLEKHQENLSDEQLNIVASLANKDEVGAEIVETIKDFFFELDELIKMYGGVNARDWSNDVKGSQPHDFDREDNIDYFAVLSGKSQSDVYLIAVDKFTGNVLGWENGSFSFDLGNMDTFDADNIIPLDQNSAKEVAYQLENTEFSLDQIEPEERNLFTLAQDEIDFGNLDRIATLSYEADDRSYDAKIQSRSAGGKFVETENPSEVSGDTEYFAIVDSTDQEAVLDVVAIQNKGGVVTVFKREGGLWVASPELQSQVQGSTPPAVSVLSDEGVLKDVLSQVDDYDLENGAAEEALTASAIFSADDLKLYVELGGQFTDYAYNRAKALNRMDLIPEDWRLHGSYTTNPSIIGEYGEVIVASGFGADTTNLEKLESYWLKGKGSEKIAWGTDFALSDGFKVFSKFIGPKRAFAFATILNNKYSGA